MVRVIFATAGASPPAGNRSRIRLVRVGVALTLLAASSACSGVSEFPSPVGGDLPGKLDILALDLSDPGSVDPPTGWALVPAGSFVMGSPLTELGRLAHEGPQRTVTITRSFLMKVTEVTQGEWQARSWKDPSSHSGCAGCPVENVNWYEALAYCNALSAAEGLPKCYDLGACTGAPGVGYTCPTAPPFAGVQCLGYRLPTEAEWEYAYRAGSTTAFYNGDFTVAGCGLDPKADAIGWYCGNSGNKTHSVAQKAPNAWGLYDMAGNVWEWVWDWHAEDAYSCIETSCLEDPLGPNTGSNRVLRGGGFFHVTSALRAAYRAIDAPGDSVAYLGFRCARSVP